MEQVTDIVDKRDKEGASTSWSGYIYQGKVAIYTAIHILNNLMESNPDLIDEYGLVIEELEDFVIEKNGLAESIHQVKAKPQNDTIGKYNEANLMLLGKLAYYENINEAILHTATELKTYSEEQFKKNIEEFSTEKKRNRLKEFKCKLFNEERGNYFNARKKLKIASENNYNGIIGVIELNQIKDVLQKEIKRFYEIVSYSDLSKVEENIEYVYANFLFLIEKLVHDSHLDKKRMFIEFTEIKKLLENKSIFTYKPETVVLILLQTMSNQYNHYINDYTVDEPIEIKYFKKWKQHLNALSDFDKKDFYSLCTRLKPHKIFNTYNQVDIQDLIEIMEPTSVKDIFFPALLETGERIEVPVDLKKAYIIHENGQFHSLTTLLDSKKTYANVGKKIFENIQGNEELFNLLYDIDVFITGYLNNEYQGKITDVKTDKESMVIRENDNRETIVAPKTIRFMDIETFIGDVDE